MYDHSYNRSTIKAVLNRGDFKTINNEEENNRLREELIQNALNSAANCFSGENPVVKFHLKQKNAYKVNSKANDIVLRKVAKNLKISTKQTLSSRSTLICHLKLLLEEGIPYGIYRVDIKNFYESFPRKTIDEKLQTLHGLSLMTKRHLITILDNFEKLGGSGLPRGMAISAILSDFLMADFDSAIQANEVVHYYGRYVDDIIIITNLNENPDDFLKMLALILPVGLQLNEKKCSFNSVELPLKGDFGKKAPKQMLSVEYLGYALKVFNPKHEKNIIQFRKLNIEISDKKIKKIQTRICRALLEYKKNRNELLLVDRVKYLTTNFEILDKKTMRRKLAGIYYSYPLLTSPKTNNSLMKLDNFLKFILTTSNKRLAIINLPKSLLNRLLGYSFKKGHENKTLVYFSSARIGEIKQCWKYE